jgi:hypothetical protein
MVVRAIRTAISPCWRGRGDCTASSASPRHRFRCRVPTSTWSSICGCSVRKALSFGASQCDANSGGSATRTRPAIAAVFSLARAATAIAAPSMVSALESTLWPCGVRT